MAGREHQAIARMRNFRPQHAGRIDEHHVIAKIQPLLRFRHGRLIADGSDALFQQGIHQRGFTDVRNPHDHHAQRLQRSAAMRRELHRKARHLQYIGRLLAAQRDCMHVLLAIVKIQPGLGRDRIGKIGFIEDFQARTLAEQAQLIDHRIRARLWQACIDDFNHQIGLFHRFRRFLAGGVHVTGEPLYGHAQLNIGNRPLFYLLQPRRLHLFNPGWPIRVHAPRHCAPAPTGYSRLPGN